MKFYVDCVGCEQRQMDAQRVINYLEANGHRRAGSPINADYTVLITCGVDKAAERSSLRRLSELADSTPSDRLIVSGCLPAISPDEIAKYGSFRNVSPKSMDEFDEVFAGQIATPMKNIPNPNTSIFDQKDDPTGLLNELTPRGEYNLAKNGYKIRVNNGCLLSCSYCVIRNAMGRLVSVPFDNLVAQFEKAVAEKKPTIMIMGGDTGAYGYDVGTRFYKLLERFLSIPGSHRIFVHDFNVNWYLQDVEEYNRVFAGNENHGRLRGVMLPVQSGSNRVLKLMKRPYRAEDVVEKLKQVKKDYQALRLGTHIITGFPSETESDVDETIRLLEEIDFDFMTTFVYSEHKQARSSKIDGKVDHEVARRRALRISERFGDKVTVVG